MPPSFNLSDPPFFGADTRITLADADVVIFGAPHGTPYEGIDNRQYETAPDALRKAMAKCTGWLDHWDFDLGGPLLGDGNVKVADAGNLATSPLDGAGNRLKIRKATAQIVADGGVPMMIGGDDSTPIPFIEALAPLGPLTIVQVDAHIDWRDERHGEPLGFSSTMRRASEMAHVEAIVQVGMRGLGSARRVEVETSTEWGAKLITARAVHSGGVEVALKHLKPGTNCMITFDCDGLDSSIMPAVMAPTPGGVTYTQAIDLIAGVAEKANLVGFDLVEFVPGLDKDGTSTFTAARVFANAIGCIARS